MGGGQPELVPILSDAALDQGHEWRDPSTRYGYKSKDEIKKIKAHNTKLTNAVKSAKSAYEHAVKAQQLLSELRQKYNY